MENCSCLPVMTLLQGLGGFLWRLFLHVKLIVKLHSNMTSFLSSSLANSVQLAALPPSKSTPQPFSTNARHHQAGSSFPPQAVVPASADSVVKQTWTARQRVSYPTSVTKRNLVWTDREAACVKVVGAGVLGAVRQPTFSIRNTKITLFHCKAKAK